MTTKRSMLTTDPLPAPVEPPIGPIPPLTDADRAWERLQAPAREKAQIEQAAVEAERRLRQDGAVMLARALLKTLDPVRAALATWRARPPAGGLPARMRAFGQILLDQIDAPIRHAGVLEALLGTERTLARLIGQLEAPALLEPAQLEATIATLHGLRGQLAGIPSGLLTHRRLCAEAVTACEGAQRLLSEHITWLTPPPAKGADT